jgi:hypothetical protein
MNEDKFNIIKTNLKLDLNDILKSNFIDSKKGYIPFLFILCYSIFKKLPFRKFIKNNTNLPVSFCEKNYVLNIKPINKPYLNYSEDVLDKYNLDLNFKHLPSFSFLSNIKSEDSEYLKIKLAGIEHINREGLIFINKLLIDNSNRFNFKVKLNNLEIKNDNQSEPSIYGWIFFKSKGILPSRMLNLNILLAKNGYGKIANINSLGIYDEHIFYYMNDIIEAEKDAKIRAKGIWRDQKSDVITGYANSKFFSSTISSFFKYSKWQKIILRKNYD